jgi:hypothetical protein
MVDEPNNICQRSHIIVAGYQVLQAVSGTIPNFFHEAMVLNRYQDRLGG